MHNLITLLRKSLPAVGFYSGLYLALKKSGIVETLLPFLKGAPENIKIEWTSRIVSNCNAIFIVLRILRLFYRDERVRHDLIYYVAPEAMDTAPLFFGYVAYDLALCLSNQCLRAPSIIFHHSLYLILSAFFYTYQRCSGFGSYLTLNEISTLFLNQRWFFQTAETITKVALSSKLVMGNQLLFVVSFFLFRVVINTANTVNVVTTMKPKETVMMKVVAYLCFPVLCVLNW
eukprot:TRINITY_DN20415_c0_g2_i1.p1 TRINITY_DN20415_c0_g2~~TRINITY_DN20415_c0_g2_i1.p1  ORF type:complete len:231 (-),score=57.42 TRINITY_DN20415_c0_g2_i1:1-693(-)